MKFLSRIREVSPLVHNMVNSVVVNYVANGLIALGASPFMSDSVDEVEEIQSFSSALVVNIGTLSKLSLEAMILAGKTANSFKVPIVLDPVGVGATALRRGAVESFLSEFRVSLIRGNGSELRYMHDGLWVGKGVDSGSQMMDGVSVTRDLADRHSSLVLMTGEVDVISDGRRTALVRNGSTMLTKVTGSGCLLSSICGAFVGVAEVGEYFDAVVEATTVYGIAAELAASELLSTQNGLFSLLLLDKLSAISEIEYSEHKRVEYV